MGSADLTSQYNLFLKYWQKGIEESDLGVLKTANNVREKSLENIESLVTEVNRLEIAEIYEYYAEFVFDYFLALNKAKHSDAGKVHQQLNEMAKRAVSLHENIFLGHYFLAVYSSWNIMQPTAGKGPALYQEGDLAANIVGSAFTLLGKGLVLGATAAGAGITRSTFNGHVTDMINAFNFVLGKSPPSAFDFLTMVPKVFNMAEYCEDNGFGAWRDIYASVCKVPLDELDYSEIDPERLDQAKEEAMEFFIIADSKI